MISKVRSHFRSIVTALCAGISLSGMTAIFVACVTTPETNRKQLNFIPDSQMNAMGIEAYSEMLAKEKLSTNRAQTEIVVQVGRAIAQASAKNYEWEFNLFDQPKIINAFCLPGGKVGVYTGILPVAENDAGLAAIMGHEVAHAVLRHGAERVSQTIVIQSGIALASLSFKDERYRNAIAGALGIGAQFGFLMPYSRKHETEADIVGLKYMALAGYNPYEAASFWERMAKIGGGSQPMEILSTHPDPLKRAETLRKEAEKLMPLYQKSVHKPNNPLPL